jgi:hypothetical protein
VGRPKGKRLLGRPGCKRQDNNRMYVKETRYGGVDWIDLSQDGNRLNMAVNLRGCIKL